MITLIDDAAIAISAITGCSTPIIASGIAITLYPNAQNRFCFIFLNVSLLSVIAFVTLIRFPFTSIMSAASIAMSVPVPIAIPTFACFNAGASFIPSPTNATYSFSCIFFIVFAFSSGSTSAITSSIPVCFAMYFAVNSLSPVSIIVLYPLFFSSCIACFESSLIVSATLIIPIISLFFDTSIVVFPSFSSSCIFCLCSS